MKLEIYGNGETALKESHKPKAEQGFCVFKVKACGICGSDIPRAFNNKAYFYPLVPGHEFAGIVEDSTNPALIGKRACVFPVLPCGECEQCKNEEYANCVSYDYYGSRRDGGMQDYLLVKEKNLVFLPDNVSFTAGAMLEPTAVCLHAMKKAQITDCSRVHIYGAGTIGLICALWARKMGAERVTVFDIDERKLDFARHLGFETKGKEESFDIAVDACGAALKNAVSEVSSFGKVILVGNAERDVSLSIKEFSSILRKQLTLFGSWNSSFSGSCNEWKESADAISNGYIDPEALITHRYPLQKATDAFEMIGERQEFFNKVMVEM